MKRLTIAGVGIVALFLARDAAATGEAARYYCMELSAQVSTSPPTILLKWPFYTNATSFTVYRRNLGDTSWGSGTSFGSNAVSYTDTVVSIGSAYEYRVSRSGGTSGSGSGYVYAGIEPPPIEDRGKVILLVDSTTATNLPAELARLQQDLVGDGWTVLRHDVSRSEGYSSVAVANVKAIVKADYDADTNNVKSLFIFGRVPVQFSGNDNPDGHGARAFPTDLYYAELDGTTWTDTSVSNTSWGDPNNWNVRGDGKPDQSYLQSVPELESGRVDMYNMPSFTNWPEQALLQRYLNKDHAFRQARMNIQRRGLVNDTWNLTTAQEGWRNFAPFFGPTNVAARNWWDMQTESYLWAYSCGYGQDEVGPPSTFASYPLKTVFTMLFGSWSGDWEDADNKLRCVLASMPSGLTCSWADGGGFGGYYYYYHPMALGQTAGYCARYSQATAGSAPVWMELMGDPTLRMHPVMPPAAPTTTLSGSDVVVQWGVSPDTSIRGYHVYRSASLTSGYVRLNGALLTGTNYTDSIAPAGTNYYMIRAVKLETSASGTYLNPSQGAFARYPGNTVKLVVISPYGTALPVSTNSYGYATDLTLALLASAVTQGAIQYVCTGWTGTGNVPASGTGTNLPQLFLTDDSTLVWQWSTNYPIDIAVNGVGTVDVSSGWFAAGSTVTITASATPPSRFMQWTGSGVPPGSGGINPLVLTVDQARQVQANFGTIAATTNSLPFVASFEDYPPNFMLPGTDGWSAVYLNFAVVSTNPGAIGALTNFTAVCGFPLAATNHAQVLQISGDVSNQFSFPTGKVVWIDTMMAFDLGAYSLLPRADPAAQLAVCARTNGHVTLWHADLAQGSSVWTELAQTVEEGRWYRLTVKLDYGTIDTNHWTHYFQVDMDGRTLSDASAYTANDGSGVTGGTWFASACLAGNFSQMCLGGTGFFDDIVVTTNNPHNRLATLGTPEWWLMQYGLTNAPATEELSDRDCDGLLNWQEFVAGTDPLNPASVFRIRGLGGGNGRRFPMWFDSVAGRLYAIRSTTNLLVNDWLPCEYATTLEGSLQSSPLTSTGGLVTIFVEPVTFSRFYWLNVTR